MPDECKCPDNIVFYEFNNRCSKCMGMLFFDACVTCKTKDVKLNALNVCETCSAASRATIAQIARLM